MYLKKHTNCKNKKNWILWRRRKNKFWETFGDLTSSTIKCCLKKRCPPQSARNALFFSSFIFLFLFSWGIWKKNKKMHLKKYVKQIFLPPLYSTEPISGVPAQNDVVIPRYPSLPALHHWLVAIHSERIWDPTGCKKFCQKVCWILIFIT